MEEVRLRLAVPDDAAGMLAVREAAILGKAARHYSRSMLKAWVAEAGAARAEQFQHEMGDEDFLTIVAEAEGALVGFGIIIKSEGLLRAVYTAPEAPKTTGLQLLAALLAGARAAGLGGLTCEASLNSVDFYKRNGFRVLERGMHVLANGMGMECVHMARGMEALKIT